MESAIPGVLDGVYASCCCKPPANSALHSLQRVLCVLSCFLLSLLSSASRPVLSPAEPLQTLPPKSELDLPALSVPKLNLPDLPVLADLLPTPTGPAATAVVGPAPSPAAVAQSEAVTSGGLTVSPDRTAAEPGLTPYSHYPAPADNASNPPLNA